MSSGARVLQVLQPEDGGVAEHVLSLAIGLRARGFEVEVASSPTNTIRPALARAGIPAHELPIARPPGPADLRAAGALRALDRRGRYDLVHAHSSKAGGIARAVLGPAERLVYTPHCFAFAAQGPPAERLAYRLAEQALVHRCAAIVAVGEWERAEAARALSGAASRTRLIRNGVVPCPEAEPDPGLLEFKGDLPLAGLVTVLRPQKDPVAAIRAAALLAGREKPVRLAIVGNGQLAGRIDAEIASLGVRDSVRRFPFEGDVARYLRALEVFVLPSLWEALPLAPIEAMTCGLPVLGTTAGGIPEIVEHGRTGLLVAPGDSESLARALEDLLADPDKRGAMGEAGRAVAAERFGLERMLDETAALYRELLGATRERGT